MAQSGLMSTVPRELRELYYDVVECPDLGADGTMSQASRAASSNVPETTSLVYKDELRIPKEIGPVMNYEEQLRASGGGPYFTPMVSLGNKKDLDLTRETFQLLDAHLSIRVLHLLPAKSLLDDIECELQVVRLVDNPVYEALSYTWGDESHRRFISVNGQRFSITSNLWAALRYLRRASETRVLWVDAVCINQQNVLERNFMVSQMHVIYHNSKRVVAWLGDPTVQSEQAFSFLKKYMSEGPPMGDDQEGWQSIVEKSKPMHVNMSTWEAFLDIFGRPWWSRAWIVQEVSCSRAGWTLMCGSSELSGNHLSCILPRYFDALEESDVPPEAKTILDSSPFAVLRMALSSQDQIGTVLVRHRKQKAKEEKDKVYAFMNMVAPAITELKPDYAKPTAEVYYQTAVQMIVKGDNLKVLSICESRDEEDLQRLTSIDGIPRRHLPGLPTWVPNWAATRLSSELWGGYISEKVTYPFEASGWKAPEVKFHGSSLAESKGLLTIKGKIIATVEQLGRDCYGESFSEAIQDAFRVLANKSIVVPAGQNGGDGILRSFTLDRDAEGERTYDDMAKEPPEITRSMHRAIIGRRFFRSKEGFVGLGPRGLKSNDKIALIPGCHVPIALRAALYKKETNKIKCDNHADVAVCLGLGCAKNFVAITQRYEVIGETYLHGVMNGELSSLLESDLKEFVLAGTEEKVKL